MKTNNYIINFRSGDSTVVKGVTDVEVHKSGRYSLKFNLENGLCYMYKMSSVKNFTVE